MVFDKTTGSSYIEFYLPSSYIPTVMYTIMIYPRPESIHMHLISVVKKGPRRYHYFFIDGVSLFSNHPLFSCVVILFYRQHLGETGTYPDISYYDVCFL